MNHVTRDWRKFLTAAEKKAMAALDKQIDKLADQAAILRMKRNKIQNRATARARQ